MKTIPTGISTMSKATKVHNAVKSGKPATPKTEKTKVKTRTSKLK